MRLYSTLTSPYGRIARIVLEEKGLLQKVNFIKVKTRGENNPYYQLNPSGRVPALLLPDGTLLEDSILISWYLDHLDGNPSFHIYDGEKILEIKRLEAMARSMLDGTSLWWREYLYRKESERSETLIQHERSRALRLADKFEDEVDKSILSGKLNMAQIVLACVLHGRDNANPKDFPWREGRPKLKAWVERIGKRHSIENTKPPD